MIKTTLFGSALAVALSAAPAMAADFHALKGLQGAAPAPLQEGVLAATEGGAICAGPAQTADTTGGGVCLASSIVGTVTSADFAVANAAPVAVAIFLMVGG